MSDHLLVLNFDCEDVTGNYVTSVVLERRNGMYIAYYTDFDNITTISRTRRDLDYWLPAMLRTMLAEESGIVPKVRFRNVEVWEKEKSPDVRASRDS